MPRRLRFTIDSSSGRPIVTHPFVLPSPTITTHPDEKIDSDVQDMLSRLAVDKDSAGNLIVTIVMK